MATDEFTEVCRDRLIARFQLTFGQATEVIDGHPADAVEIVPPAIRAAAIQVVVAKKAKERTPLTRSTLVDVRPHFIPYAAHLALAFKFQPFDELLCRALKAWRPPFVMSMPNLLHRDPDREDAGSQSEHVEAVEAAP